LFTSFQAVPRLGGLGDFGISGAIGVRAGQMIGRNDYDRLRLFLASARTLFLVVAFAAAFVFFALSPWLPHWLSFQSGPGTGSLTLLFQTGAIALLLMIVGGYFHNLNAAYGTVTWPILPALLISQLALGAHWLLALWGCPLWAQNLPYQFASGLNILAVWYMLKLAHPWLSELRPLKRDLALWREIITASAWIYLYGLGNVIFTMTDRLLVNAGFGASAVTPYVLNYKPCELTLQVVLSASFVSLTKINQWIASPAAELRERARSEVQRLCLFQSVLGTACALGYLSLNNLFIQYWMGPAYQVPAPLQWAFALNLAITTGGDAGIQIAGVCGPRGLRTAGLAIGLTGLLNLALSFAAMKAGWLAGIAYATVIAQTVLSLVLGRYTCRHLNIPTRRWFVCSWLLPLVSVVLMAAAHHWMGSASWGGAFGLLGVGALIVLAGARLGGLTLDFVRQEWTILRAMLQRK
jgi:O-antigen/teichoic acid export membrane protein